MRERGRESSCRARLLGLMLLECLVAGCGASVKSAKLPAEAPSQRGEPTPAVEADTLQSPRVRLELAAEEKAALAARAQKDLDEVAETIRGIERERLTAEELERLQLVESMITSAKAAGEKDDVQAMASLARKARLLVAELLPD